MHNGDIRGCNNPTVPSEFRSSWGPNWINLATLSRNLLMPQLRGAPYLNEQTITDNDLYGSQSYFKLDCPRFPVLNCAELSSSASKFTPSILRSFVHSLTYKSKTCHIWHHGMLAIISFAGGRKELIEFCWENVPQSDPQHLIEAPPSISRNRRETWTRPVLLVAYGRYV